MELAGEIRHKAGNYILRRKAVKISRIVSYKGLSFVRKIAIIWNSNMKDLPVLEDFHKRMIERNIEIKVISYCAEKDIPEKLSSVSYIKCFGRKDVGLFFFPVKQEAAMLLNEKFDIIIDMNFDKKLPLKYFSSMSDSSFRIGLYESDQDSEVYDLMIDLKKPVDPADYLDQAIYYLEMIKPIQKN